MLHLREDVVMSAEIHYQRLNADNFTGYSLDDFVRHQTVTESWRKKAGDWKLVPNVYEETGRSCSAVKLQKTWYII